MKDLNDADNKYIKLLDDNTKEEKPSTIVEELDNISYNYKYITKMKYDEILIKILMRILKLNVPQDTSGGMSAIKHKNKKNIEILTPNTFFKLGGIVYLKNKKQQKNKLLPVLSKASINPISPVKTGSKRGPKPKSAPVEVITISRRSFSSKATKK